MSEIKNRLLDGFDAVEVDFVSRFGGNAADVISNFKSFSVPELLGHRSLIRAVRGLGTMLSKSEGVSLCDKTIDILNYELSKRGYHDEN